MKKRTFKVGDRVMIVGTVVETATREVRVSLDGDEVHRWFMWQALHPHTVRTPREGVPEKAKKKVRVKK